MRPDLSTRMSPTSAATGVADEENGVTSSTPACGAAVTGGVQGPYDRRVDIRLSPL